LSGHKITLAAVAALAGASALRRRGGRNDIVSTVQVGRQQILSEAVDAGRINVSQRWREGMSDFVPNTGTVPKAAYEVEQIDGAVAKCFVKKHHYLPNFPQIGAAYGLYTNCGAKLVGVAIWSNAARNSEVRYGRVEKNEIRDLSRLVLLDEVPGNAESFFVAEARRQYLKYHKTKKRTFGGSKRTPSKLRVLLSMSDPVPVSDSEGNIILPGHIGNVYQALNAYYVGRSSPKTQLVVTPGGHIMAGRGYSKVDAWLRDDSKAGRGGETMLDRLDKMLPVRGFKEARRRSGKTTEALLKEKDGRGRNRWGLRTQHHPGNIVYAWLVGDKRENRATLKRLPAPTVEIWIQRMILPDVERLRDLTGTPAKYRRASAQTRLLAVGALGYPIQPSPVRQQIASDKLGPTPQEICEPAPWWLGKLAEGGELLRQDAHWRGLDLWLRRKGQKMITALDILGWAKENPYPKEDRQKYISLLRKMQRVWTTGTVDRINNLAVELLDVWGRLSAEEQAGLLEPPQVRLKLTCRLRGSSNKWQNAVWSTEELLQAAYCG
jgi:hypothetical protein